MAAEDPAERSRNASIASNAFWATVPDRAEFTRQAHVRSPCSYDYWLNKINEEAVIRPQDRPAAAENAHKAYMRQLSKRASIARRNRART